MRKGKQLHRMDGLRDELVTSSNPYTMVFGKIPPMLIAREPQMRTLLLDIQSDNPKQQVCVITGVRGCGKTVFMTEIVEHVRQDQKWTNVELSPDRDMLSKLASELSSEHQFAEWFQSAGINLSFFGFGLSVKNNVPITDIEVALVHMLKSLSKHGKHLLITVDEVNNTEHLRVFIGAFQRFIRENLPVYLVMTGLYENLYALQNVSGLTFLYRAPRIELKPLDMRTISENYQKELRLSDEEARNMAKLTRGYSFAFQVLGYHLWESKEYTDVVLTAFRQDLYDYSYMKIWSELSSRDKQVAYAIAKSESGKVREIKEILGIQNNQFNPYRQRLIRKGILDGSEFGCVRFILPLFDQFVIDQYEMEHFEDF